MNNKIIEAKFLCKSEKAIIISILFSLVGVALYLLISYVVEVKYITGSETLFIQTRYTYTSGYNILDDEVYIDYDGEKFSEGFHPMECFYDISIDAIPTPANVTSFVFYGACICLIIAVGLMAVTIYSKVISKKCTISLEDTGIIGKRVKFFLKKELKLPMDKIDNITIQCGIFDKIFGGQTIAIRSASGLIKFPWVQNAQEFVDTTLVEIQKYNESVKLKNQSVSVNSATDDFEKIQKLKALLDQGLLTQEEYEEKRKELLEKI